MLKSPLRSGDSGDNDDNEEGGACRGGGGFYLFIFAKTNDTKMLPALFFTPAETKILVQLSALVERFGVSRMRDFSHLIYKHIKTNVNNNDSVFSGFEELQLVW